MKCNTGNVFIICSFHLHSLSFLKQTSAILCQIKEVEIDVWKNGSDAGAVRFNVS